MIGSLVYVLCTVTSFGCAALLWRGYGRSRMRLLFWASLCFATMGIANALLFLDLVVFPALPLLPVRNMFSQLSYLILLYGLIFETK